VRSSVADPPASGWSQATHFAHIASQTLDAGEEAAIALAIELHADLLLMDDEEGVIAARGKGLEVTGTLGLLGRAAERHFPNLAEAFDRLKHTNFRFRQEIMDRFLAEQGSKS
jgi:predicted nucleic acid-binding protein